MNWLNPEEVQAWYNDLGEGSSLTAAVEFVKALANNSRVDDEDLHPYITKPCDCYVCHVTRIARLIARRLEGGDEG